MADSTVGQLGCFPVGTESQLKTTPGNTLGGWGFRYALASLGAPGTKTISGFAHQNAANAIRRIVVMTQPPAPQIIYEFTTDLLTGIFACPAHLPSGNYLVLDCMTDNSRQALVYDWVVSG